MSAVRIRLLRSVFLPFCFLPRTMEYGVKLTKLSATIVEQGKSLTHVIAGPLRPPPILIDIDFGPEGMATTEAEKY